MAHQTIDIHIDPPVSIREKIYQQVKNEILSNKIPPSATLSETQLAKQIGISRTPIREALHFLEKEGLLELIPRVGYRVRQIDWAEVMEICEIRKALEILAAVRAINRISSEEIEAFKDNLNRSEELIKSKELSALIDLDAEFHELLARASGNQRLLKLILSHRGDMLRYRMKSLHRTDTAAIAVAGHRRIFECLVKKDENGVKSAIADHLEAAKKYIQRYAFEDEAGSDGD